MHNTLFTNYKKFLLQHREMNKDSPSQDGNYPLSFRALNFM